MDQLKIELPEELFAVAESSHFEGQLNIDRLDAGFDIYLFDQPLSWEVDMTNTGEGLLVAGSITGRGTTDCARCLDEFGFDFDGEVEGYFVFASDCVPEGYDDDEFDYLGEDHVVDLEPLLIAALLVECPLIPLCKEECEGLCTACGANLNDGPCKCEPVEAEDDPFELARNPFAALKNLKLDE